MSTRHKHPEGALCAAGGFYPPLRFEWEAAAIQQTALSRLASGGFYPPLRDVCKTAAYSVRMFAATFLYFLPGGVASTCFFHIHRV